MTDIILFTAPNTCGKVPLILLEEIGVPFETRLIRHLKAEHKSPEFKRFNPAGKVPALVFDGAPLTENVAIAAYLNLLYPDAELLPKVDALGRARQIADLCFCSATLHPFVTRICVPQFFADPVGVRSLQRVAKEGIVEYLRIAEDRLESGPWWYDNAWSAMDPYLYWIFWRILTGSDFDVTPFPRLIDHARRLEERPAVQRALAREADDRAVLESEGLLLPPPRFD